MLNPLLSKQYTFDTCLFVQHASEHFQYGIPILSCSAGQGNTRFLKSIYRQLSYEIWCLRHVYFGPRASEDFQHGTHFGPRASEDFQHGTPILSYFAGQGNTNCL